MVSRRELYERVNSVWPSPVPKLTLPEAKRAVRKLWRFVLKRVPSDLEVKLTTGNHRTRVDYHTVYVNLEGTWEGGWDHLIHNLSHHFYHHIGLRERYKAHAKDHARLELRMRNLALRRGWLNGALLDKPRAEKPAADPISSELEHAQKKVKQAATRLKRALTIHKKWSRRVKRLQAKAEKSLTSAAQSDTVSA